MLPQLPLNSYHLLPLRGRAVPSWVLQSLLAAGAHPSGCLLPHMLGHRSPSGNCVVHNVVYLWRHSTSALLYIPPSTMRSNSTLDRPDWAEAVTLTLDASYMLVDGVRAVTNWNGWNRRDEALPVEQAVQLGTSGAHPPTLPCGRHPRLTRRLIEHAAASHYRKAPLVYQPPHVAHSFVASTKLLAFNVTIIHSTVLPSNRWSSRLPLQYSPPMGPRSSHPLIQNRGRSELGPQSPPLGSKRLRGPEVDKRGGLRAGKG
ncbi:hypothetical protein EDB84DRAFT_1099074 [Lactarius hengduanensis]|nr:hypothetical protein EDB84DRAFT_1099074 [Lactarius hengduanensis]